MKIFWGGAFAPFAPPWRTACSCTVSTWFMDAPEVIANHVYNCIRLSCSSTRIKKEEEVKFAKIVWSTNSMPVRVRLSNIDDEVQRRLKGYYLHSDPKKLAWILLEAYIILRRCTGGSPVYTGVLSNTELLGGAYNTITQLKGTVASLLGTYPQKIIFI